MKTLLGWAVSTVKNLLRPTYVTPKNDPSIIETQKQVIPRFIDVLHEYMAYETETNNLSVKTREKHQYQYNNVLRFLEHTNQVDMLVSEVRVRTMEHLRLWLHEHVKQPGGRSPVSIDHSTRHLRMCRNACDFAVLQEYVNHNNISAVKTKRSLPKPIVNCDPSDIRKFEKYHNDTIPQRNMLRDYFLYQCFTGISFIDIWRHKIVEVKYTTATGQRKKRLMVSCQTGRGKNGRMYWAPFTRKAQRIWQRYNGVFPDISNQTYNRSIKKIAKECGVDLHLTTHVGRKTFATLMRIEGYSIPAISVMLGNTEEVCRRRYAAGDKDMLLAELDRLETGPLFDLDHLEVA